MAVAIARPAKTRPRLGRMFPVASAVRNRWAAGPENHRWYILATIADGCGKNELRAADVHSCQQAIPATRTTQRGAQLSRCQLIRPPRWRAEPTCAAALSFPTPSHAPSFGLPKARVVPAQQPRLHPGQQQVKDQTEY